MAGNVVGNDRLFEPGEVVGLQRARGADGFLDRPFHVGVGHQRKAVAEMFSHRLHARDVGGEIRAAHLHLDGAKALGEIVVGLPEQRLDGKIEVDAAGITGHAGVEAAEQAKQRQIGAPRLQVPQRDVERRERQHRRSAASAVMQVPTRRDARSPRCRRPRGPRSVPGSRAGECRRSRRHCGRRCKCSRCPRRRLNRERGTSSVRRLRSRHACCRRG